MEYQKQKIREINKIIRVLWYKVYQANDITIMIESYPKDNGSSYNYRVMARKGIATMEMRCCCSTGQRVLAAIVIRLALADVVGLKFGCLTLDEPTANLDLAYKRSLAEKLALLIKERKEEQKNFQVCIPASCDLLLSWIEP